MSKPLARNIALAVLAALFVPATLIGQPAAAADNARSGDTLSYVLLSPGSRSATMSGSTDDMHRARALRSGQEGLLYLRHRGTAYVIRDAATLRRAEAIFTPQKALGAQQGELGSRQAALGQRQAALGMRQAELGFQQAGASPRRADELGRRQAALGQQQDALGQQQDALGRRQSALGREQERLSREADAKFRALLADAMQRGVAERVN